MTPISQLGENNVLKRLLPFMPTNESLIVGPGDDCAVISRDEHWDTLYKTDVVVEKIHFSPGENPRLIGRKALARNLSDIAAMGGTPEHALITLLVHPSRSMEELELIYQGLSDLAREWNVSIAGGETSSIPYDGLIINVALIGKVPKGQAILRSTAQANDLILVTGELGDTFHTGHHLSFTPRIKEADILRKSGIVTSMMDLSDGLATDLCRLSEASGLTFNLQTENIPCRNGCNIQEAINDGEDYELLFSINKNNYNELETIRQQLAPFVKITIIGEFLPPKALSKNIEPGGWQHFSN